jgi:peptide/nickel transport system permease protein
MSSPLVEDFVRRIKKNKLALVGLAIVVTLFLLAVFASFLAPYSPDEPNTDRILEAPSWEHPMGTDELGRDVLSRVLYGAGVSLSVGFVAVGISCLIGVVLGALAGYYGGWVASLIMRFVDIMLCFPPLFLIGTESTA